MSITHPHFSYVHLKSYKLYNQQKRRQNLYTPQDVEEVELNKFFYCPICTFPRQIETFGKIEEKNAKRFAFKN